jgi:uncharacterized protein YdaU (DUF1376 family)
MSRAWIPFYIGDYLKDKDSMPHDGSSRAAVARVPLPRWRKISAPIDAFFAADGTNKRTTAEISKAETVGPKRAIAGARHGPAGMIAGQQSPPIWLEIEEKHDEEEATTRQAERSQDDRPRPHLA